jgi:Ca2+-binding EF-hand superfamily protein
VFFDKFDKEKKGYIEATVIASILKIMGVQFNTATLRQLITEFDEDGSGVCAHIRHAHTLTGSGTFEFEEFSALVQSVEEDEGATEDELKDIFRLFDKEVRIQAGHQ